MTSLVTSCKPHHKGRNSIFAQCRSLPRRSLLTMQCSAASAQQNAKIWMHTPENMFKWPERKKQNFLHVSSFQILLLWTDDRNYISLISLQSNVKLQIKTAQAPKKPLLNKPNMASPDLAPARIRQHFPMSEPQQKTHQDGEKTDAPCYTRKPFLLSLSSTITMVIMISSLYHHWSHQISQKCCDVFKL